ncbi:MAG: hypothetical protein IJG40_12855 [Oscillospiraceae bacterium]|nr:hypothetical protein [Oscillospiraceae bacterium]
MTAFIGTVIILSLLACIPLVFLFAGRDTDRRSAVRRECQREAMLDWTDKEILSSLHDSTLRPARKPSPAAPSIRIETLPRSVNYPSTITAA